MPFLRNCWYAAAWLDEIEADPLLHRRILGEDILLTKATDGSFHAMRNRCSHRFVPLSQGERNGDVVTCPYHGLQFALGGTCLHNPHGTGFIPPNANIKSYPVEARHMLLWIWMGEPAKADVTQIPALPGLDPEHYAINHGYMHTSANYEYMSDNIMDLGHIEFLHKGLLGSEAILTAKVDVRQEGNIVYSNRLTDGEILPPALEALFEAGGTPVDRWLDVTWYPPGNMVLIVGVAKSGETERVGRETPGVHLMTPETESSTHYFWSASRNFRRDEADLHQALEQGFRFAFEQQDKPMIDAQHKAIGGEDFWDMQPVILEGDAGAVRARRVLRKLIREEQGQAA